MSRQQLASIESGKDKAKSQKEAPRLVAAGFFALDIVLGLEHPGPRYYAGGLREMLPPDWHTLDGLRLRLADSPKM